MYQAGLGADLRQLRKKTGMSTRSVAERLGISHSSIARTELGSRPTGPDEVVELCALYGVTGRQRERLIERAQGLGTDKTWYSTGSGAGEQVANLVELEMEASTLTCVALTLVPGLVQTSEYARQIIGLGRFASSQTEWLVRTRLSRQSLLSQPHAPDVRFIVDEMVLHRPVGGAALMRDQLDQLLRTGQRPNVSVQVLPLAAGAHPAVDGSFVMLDFPERESHVYLESRRGALFLSERDQVQPYAEVVKDLEGTMLDVPESAELIAEIRESMSDG